MSEKVILTSLNIPNATVVRQTCNRSNITIHVKPKKSDGKDQVAELIGNNHSGQCSIVYCLQRSDTTDMVYCLQRKGISATYYHGARDPYMKKDHVQAWQDGKAKAMCATVAFGMGINKADVRFVIHLSISQSLECYSQEFGRAGRDGGEGTCCVLFRFEDKTKHLQMIAALPESEHREKLNKLNEMVKFCIYPECRKVQLARYFDEDASDVCGCKCDFCLGNLDIAWENGNKEALEVLSCLRNMQRLQEKITWNLLVLVYRRSKRKEVLAKPFNTIPEFGKGNTVFTENSLKHFIQVLISKNVATERLRGAGETKSIPYLACGNKEGLIKTGELLIWRYKI